MSENNFTSEEISSMKKFIDDTCPLAEILEMYDDIKIIGSALTNPELLENA